MGTWGAGPFDNDDASDLIAGMMRKVQKVVDAKTRYASDGYNEARAIIQFGLVSHGSDILGGPGLDTSLRALARMRSDVEWLSGWRNPRKIANTIQNELTAVYARMSACKGCRRAPKNEREELKAIVDAALAVKVPKTEWFKRRRAAEKKKLRKPRKGGRK
jgi:hypothetical protein